LGQSAEVRFGIPTLVGIYAGLLALGFGRLGRVDARHIPAQCAVLGLVGRRELGLAVVGTDGSTRCAVAARIGTKRRNPDGVWAWWSAGREPRGPNFHAPAAPSFLPPRQGGVVVQVVGCAGGGAARTTTLCLIPSSALSIVPTVLVLGEGGTGAVGPFSSGRRGLPTLGHFVHLALCLDTALIAVLVLGMLRAVCFRRWLVPVLLGPQYWRIPARVFGPNWGILKPSADLGSSGRLVHWVVWWLGC
jgi:hypothetical protein